MRIRSLSRGLGVAFAAIFAGTPALATNIVAFAAPGVATVQKSQPLAVQVWLAFDDLTLGGGLDLAFSPGLFAFGKFTFDPAFPDDAALRRKPADGASAGPFTLAFGSFSGLVGDRLIGTLTLIANETIQLGGGHDVLSAADDLGPAGPFVDAHGDPLAVEYDGLLGTVVPEPTTALLLGAGLAAASAARRPGTRRATG